MREADIYKAAVAKKIRQHAIRGFNYQVLEWGDAERPLLVWLHGWGDCAATFQMVIDRFTEDWFVVAPDLRGFGDSAAVVSSYWFPDYLADLDRLLELYSPNAPFVLVGHSMGANIAGLYAGTMPERLRALVNVEGFGLANADPGEAPDRYRRWIEASRTVPKFADYADFAALAARIRRRSPRMSEAHAEFVARCWGRVLDGRVVLRADPLHKLPNAVLYRRAESEACWRRVTAPVLLVEGAESAFAKASDPRLDPTPMPFPNATRVALDAAGHMMHFEVPGALAAAIEAFLREHL